MLLVLKPRISALPTLRRQDSVGGEAQNTRVKWGIVGLWDAHAGQSWGPLAILRIR